MIRSALQPRHKALAAILGVSLTLRIALIVRGGQYFFPDETRYDRAIEFARRFWSGDLLSAFAYVSERGDHVGWVLVGAFPASVQLVLGSIVGRPVEDFAYLGAIILSTASVAVIHLTYLIARRLGAPAREALVAAFLAACSTSLFYWSRHLLPYDAALVLGLSGVWFAIGNRGGIGRAATCGLLAGLTFMVYNGYWTLALVVLVLATIVGAAGTRDAIIRAFGAGGAFLIPVALPLVVSALAGSDAIAHMRAFSGSVTQGDWGDGFALTVEYLWHTEHLLGLAFASALVIAGAWVVRPAPDTPEAFRTTWQSLLDVAQPLPGRTAVFGGLVAAGIFAALAIDSSVLRVFVVYGRLVRQIVPFLCLTTAFVGVWVVTRWSLPRWVVTASLVAVALQAAVNFSAPLRQEFPRELEAHLFEFTPLSHALSVDGPVLRGNTGPAAFVLVNAQFLHPPRGPQTLPPGNTVLSFPHPLEYLPYQYEGFRRHEREILRNVDISMRLIKLDAALAPGVPDDER